MQKFSELHNEGNIQVKDKAGADDIAVLDDTTQEFYVKGFSKPLESDIIA